MVGVCVWYECVWCGCVCCVVGMWMCCVSVVCVVCVSCWNNNLLPFPQPDPGYTQ